MTDCFMPLLDASEGRIVNLGSGLGAGHCSKAVGDDQKLLINKDCLWEPLEGYVNKMKAANSNNFFIYGMTKAVLSTYTMIVAKEYPNIKVSCVSPGFIETNMTKGFGAKLGPEQGTVSTRHCLLGEL
jgi:NAD(P)-dependent dehydrogenase (short-subunit alcohol dehydrogenase family)